MDQWRLVRQRLLRKWRKRVVVRLNARHTVILKSLALLWVLLAAALLTGLSPKFAPHNEREAWRSSAILAVSCFTDMILVFVFSLCK